MADTGTTSQELLVSEEVREKFPELVELILKSGSMDQEERQYWIDVLPIMTEEQVQNLRGILDNEKKQIEEANQEFQESVNEEAGKVKQAFDETAYREKKQLRLEEEKRHEAEEADQEEALLKELETM
jgi:hypothetical protein